MGKLNTLCPNNRPHLNSTRVYVSIREKNSKIRLYMYNLLPKVPDVKKNDN